MRGRVRPFIQSRPLTPLQVGIQIKPLQELHKEQTIFSMVGQTSGFGSSGFGSGGGGSERAAIAVPSTTAAV